MKQLAIVGSGIAGLGLAYYLRDQFDISIFEKDDRVGGHSNTVSVEESGREIPIDTGFMVFNHVTYPLLTRLFGELNVPTKKTDMSFSVQRRDINLEYSGASFDRLFGDRSNLMEPRFWRLLTEINRFNQIGSTRFLETGADKDEHLTVSLADFVRTHKLSDDFVELYLIPMSGALWSTPPEKLRNFPVLTLLRFFRNHGLLGQDTQHQWWTVDGGAREYVQRLLRKLRNTPRVKQAVVGVRRGLSKAVVTTSGGSQEEFHHVVLACHADEALRTLQEPRDVESRILGAFKYQPNETVLHTDTNVMPKHRRCWSSWNYRVDGDDSTTHYWMNSLQGVSRNADYFVTLNGEHLVKPEKILWRTTYHHPLFDLGALHAQGQLDGLNASSPKEQIYFCGSYFGFGFHEDALASAHRLATLISQRALCV